MRAPKGIAYGRLQKRKASQSHGHPWKQILESYFPQFMEFFFPEAYSQIDWERGFDFLAYRREDPRSN